VRDALRERLGRVFDALGCELGAYELAIAVVAAYEEPHRCYHGVAHLAACLALFDEVWRSAPHPIEVEAALAFHDLVYDPRALDNEKRSAERAKAALVAHEAPENVAARIAELVLATAHDHVEDRAEDPDAALLVDIDLAILGAPERDFEAFERGVREEYAWVDEPDYRRARARVLRAFLARPHIYRTPAIRDRLEAGARENLERALTALVGEEPRCVTSRGGRP